MALMGSAALGAVRGRLTNAYKGKARFNAAGAPR
jgi:hypothetical protein